MPYNGPAIWGGCVTRRKHRVGSWYFSHEAVTVQGGYGTCFCRPGTNFLEHYECRGTSVIEAVNLSPVTKLVAGTGAVSRYKVVSEAENCQVAVFILWADARVRVHEPLQIYLECRSKSKNRDKQLTHIVRVSTSNLFVIML
jgi:hypothetical protein